RVAVHDHHAAAAHVFDVRAQRGGIERDEHVGLVGRRAHVARGEVDLEARDARERAGWCADLGGGGRRGGGGVFGECCRFGELGSGELDAVTGVAAETDGNTFDLLGGFPHRFADHLGWGAGWATWSPASGGVHVRSVPRLAFGTEWIVSGAVRRETP